MKHKYLSDVTTLAFDVEKCIGCGRCAEVCPHGVFEINNKKARADDRDSCMECGACAMNCPAGALSVNAGVGCAAAIIIGWFTGTEPHCGCSDEGGGGACCT
jgi:NAD-dependent dihydropyrimidine dehydrogenase PreA subunit